MIPNNILRENARKQLDNNVFSNTWLMLMVVYLIYSAILSAASSISLGIAAFIISGPLMYGVIRICTGLVKGKKSIQIEEMFVGFKECFTESFLLSLLTSVFTFLWSLLFIVPGVIKSYSYAMAPYILQDDPSKGWKESLDESKQIMNGHKMELFCLDLSFIGWYIVGFLCCCIGIVFVYPYHLLARANFYMALKAMNEPEHTEFDGGSEYEDNTSYEEKPLNDEENENEEENGSEPVDPFA